MKQGQLFRKSKPDNFEDKNIKISNSIGRSIKLKAHSYGNILFIEYDKENNIEKEKLPYDIENKFFDLDSLYAIFNSIGSENVIEFEIVPTFGPFIDVVNNERYNVETIFANSIYPIKRIIFKIDSNKAIFNFYKDNSVVYNVGFNVNKYIRSEFKDNK